MTDIIPDPPGEIVVLMKFGSHLYGTDGPNSDVDYKGIFIPDDRSVMLGRIPKSIHHSTGPKGEKNSPGDVDVEWFSLHQFVKLACEGQTVAMDMLHAPHDWPMVTSDVWVDLQFKADKFNTKSLKAFLGYCRRQAAKYGVKGSRLAAVREVIEKLEAHPRESRLQDIQNIHPNEHAKYDLSGERKFLVVCGRKLQNTITVAQALEPLHKFAGNYGQRAEQAARNEGIDWKAVSHALRAGYELSEIYHGGRIAFPLRQAEYLKRVKAGELDYLTEVAPELEGIIEEVEALADASNYPESVDTKFWDDWLVEQIGKHTMEYSNPKWDEAGRVHDWRNHVPKDVKDLWDSFSDEQKWALFEWAEGLASYEEWD